MSKIGIQIAYEGTETGAQAIDSLLEKMGGLLTAEERAAISGQRFERSLKIAADAAARARAEVGGATAATTTFGRAQTGAGSATEAAGRKAGQFASAVGNVGNALRSVHPTIGPIAGEIASIGASMTASVTTMGPFGIAVGVITAGLGLWSMATRMAEDDAEEHRRALERALPTMDEYLSRLRQAREEQSRQRRLAMNLGTSTEHQEQEDRALVAERRAFAERGGAQLTVNRSMAGSFAQRRELEREGGYRDQLAAAETRYNEASAALESARAATRTARAEENAIIEADTMGTEGGVESDAPSRRRGGGGRERAEAARREREELAALRQEMAEQAAEKARVQQDELWAIEQAARLEAERRAGLLEEQEIRYEMIEREREGAEARQRALVEEREARDRLTQKENEAAEARLAQAREITGKVGDTLTTIASAYIDAFGQAIEGQKTLEQAALEATKSILKGLGMEMVQIGFRETMEGFANIVSSPPIAATKIPMGIALIAGGVALGAAGAAIPSGAAAGAASPRAEESKGGDGEKQTLVINYNQPIVAAATTAQLSRQMTRQIRDGQELPTRRATA